MTPQQRDLVLFLKCLDQELQPLDTWLWPSDKEGCRTLLRTIYPNMDWFGLDPLDRSAIEKVAMKRLDLGIEQMIEQLESFHIRTPANSEMYSPTEVSV